MKEDRGEICIFSPKREGTCRKTASPTGADGRIRTGDLILTKDALYLLSYISAPFIRRTQGLLYYRRRRNAIPWNEKIGFAQTFYNSGPGYCLGL